MAGEKGRTFGEVLRRRRRELDLTQGELAQTIETSTPYVGLLESDQRHPSDAIVSKLADALGLERSELFFLANPDTRELLEDRDPGCRQGGFGLGAVPSRSEIASAAQRDIRRNGDVAAGRPDGRDRERARLRLYTEHRAPSALE